MTPQDEKKILELIKISEAIDVGGADYNGNFLQVIKALYDEVIRLREENERLSKDVARLYDNLNAEIQDG